MKEYCFDTSGISNPLNHMPEDIFPSIWRNLITAIEEGRIAVTREIYDEMCHIPGAVGVCIQGNRDNLLLEVNDDQWDWRSYVAHVRYMLETHHEFISEFSGGSPRTIGQNDLSIIALAKTLSLPLVSMEISAGQSTNKRRIPDICRLENVEHIDFNEFLRREKIVL